DLGRAEPLGGARVDGELEPLPSRQDVPFRVRLPVRSRLAELVVDDQGSRAVPVDAVDLARETEGGAAALERDRLVARERRVVVALLGGERACAEAHFRARDGERRRPPPLVL